MNSIKNDKYRDLLCHAAQFIIDQGLFEYGGEKGVVMVSDFCGKRSLIQWRIIAFDEVEITVWWGYKSSVAPQEYSNVTLIRPYSRVFDLSVSGFLERNDGFWIQGKTLRQLCNCYCSHVAYHDFCKIPEYSGKIAKTGKFIL